MPRAVMRVMMLGMSGGNMPWPFRFDHCDLGPIGDDEIDGGYGPLNSRGYPHRQHIEWSAGAHLTSETAVLTDELLAAFGHQLGVIPFGPVA